MHKKNELSLKNKKELFSITRALASEIRLDMLELLRLRSYNVNELAEKLNIPNSTAALNVKVLEDSGLIITELQPGVRGAMKLCSIKFEDIHIQISNVEQQPTINSFFIHMPIGQYVDCSVAPTCGIVNEKGYIDMDDNPKTFYHPDRASAQLIWFYKGYLEYRFHNSILDHGSEKLLEISLELCSEAPHYRNNWPSDITMWINEREVGTWSSPGDFGGRRGKLNPHWWSDASTQYGMLKTWRVGEEGSYIDEMPVSGVRLSDLELNRRPYISVRIGIKEDAANVGGINIFGEKFGDYAQPIVMRIDYEVGQR